MQYRDIDKLEKLTREIQDLSRNLVQPGTQTAQTTSNSLEALLL